MFFLGNLVIYKNYMSMPTAEESKQYYANLPAKLLAAGVIFYNENKEILLVKPNYREGWSIPGGTLNANETPVQAATREVQEEIFLAISKLTLICVDYMSADNYVPENLQFIFYGGILNQEQINTIKIQQEELDAYEFVSPENAAIMLRKNLAKRLPHCIEAIENNKIIYLENGNKI